MILRSAPRLEELRGYLHQPYDATLTYKNWNPKVNLDTYTFSG